MKIACFPLLRIEIIGYARIAKHIKMHVQCRCTMICLELVLYSEGCRSWSDSLQFLYITETCVQHHHYYNALLEIKLLLCLQCILIFLLAFDSSQCSPPYCRLNSPFMIDPEPHYFEQGPTPALIQFGMFLVCCLGAVIPSDLCFELVYTSVFYSEHAERQAKVSS